MRLRIMCIKLYEHQIAQMDVLVTKGIVFSRAEAMRHAVNHYFLKITETDRLEESSLLLELNHAKTMSICIKFTSTIYTYLHTKIPLGKMSAFLRTAWTFFYEDFESFFEHGMSIFPDFKTKVIAIKLWAANAAKTLSDTMFVGRSESIRNAIFYYLRDLFDIQNNGGKTSFHGYERGYWKHAREKASPPISIKTTETFLSALEQFRTFFAIPDRSKLINAAYRDHQQMILPV